MMNVASVLIRLRPQIILNLIVCSRLLIPWREKNHDWADGLFLSCNKNSTLGQLVLVVVLVVDSRA